MSFQIRALPKLHFEPLFDFDDEALALRHAIRMAATEKPGFPCRVSLQDAEVGEEVILVHYEHLAVDSPFRSSHAIYVRRDAHQAMPGVGEVPQMLRSRILSLRAFDNKGMMRTADLADGKAVEAAIENMLEDPAVAYLHLHFAKPGCYAASVVRS